MDRHIKALILLGLSLYLGSRLLTGSLFFYISQRFAWLTALAVVGAAALAFSYYAHSARPSDEHAHDHHDHGSLTWVGIVLVALPILLGLTIPPKPLGAGAMDNRDIQVGTLTSVNSPENAAFLTPPAERNIVDWLKAFKLADGPERFNGQEGQVLGFVYQDERFDSTQFMVSRFIVSCCVADASPVGLIVEWSETPALDEDQWVTVRGTFQVGEFDGEVMPILMAEDVTVTESPEHPYLYY